MANSIAAVVEKVNRLDDRPILVVLPVGVYWLDMTTDDDMIPFNGEPVYADGQGWGGAPEMYGLEAIG